jgi:hypothetical protein
MSKSDDDRDFHIALTDTRGNVEIADWAIGSDDLGIVAATPFKVWKKTLHGGKQEGSTLIGVDAGELSVTVIPTRGMNIHKAQYRGIEHGWASPVDEIVHPAYMRLDERGGLGFLDGFNEMMARCGYEWSGHPCTEDSRLYSLHGRASSTPASRVTIDVERTAPHRIRITGLLKEKTFKFCNFEIAAELIVVPGEAGFHVRDRLTNRADYATPYQIIYHTNFGRPLLGEGSRFLAPVKRLAPIDERAQQGVPTWQTYAGPTRGFDEEVFICELHGDAAAQTLAALVNPASDKGVALRFNLDELPFFTLWKNTDTERQGYVTGLEPCSNPPYSRTVEKQTGRLKSLPAGGTQDFGIDVQFLTTAGEVAAVEAEIHGLQKAQQPQIEAEPVFARG